MMTTMNLIVVPDVHGRSFWRDPIEHIKDFDNIIFLGDYVDPYEDEDISRQDAIQVLKDIIELKSLYPDKVILLLGNHDCQYIFDEYVNVLPAKSRFDWENYKEIGYIYKSNIDKFQIAWECENKEYGKRLLFTHAGVTNRFKDVCGLNANEINNFFLKEDTNGVPNTALLATISWYRGGPSMTGSPIWADVREHIKSQVPQVFQVFGHTYCADAVIYKHFAMLDRGDSCFILDDNGIRKY